MSQAVVVPSSQELWQPVDLGEPVWLLLYGELTWWYWQLVVLVGAEAVGVACPGLCPGGVSYWQPLDTGQVWPCAVSDEI